MDSNKRDKISPNVLDRYVYLTNLRDDASVTEGERTNAQGAIDTMCNKLGLTESDFQECLDRSGVAKEMFVGADEPHIAQFKRSLIAVVAAGEAIKVAAHENGQRFVLIGPKNRIQRASELFRYLLTTFDEAAELCFSKRSVRMHDGAEEKKASWIHSFKQGMAVSVKERLEVRNIQRIQEEARVNGFTEEVQREQEKAELQHIMECLADSPELRTVAEKMAEQFKKDKAEKAEEDRLRLEELGIVYNGVGFSAGRLMGKQLSLQKEVTA